jgi:hypothetical protein
MRLDDDVLEGRDLLRDLVFDDLEVVLFEIRDGRTAQRGVHVDTHVVGFSVEGRPLLLGRGGHREDDEQAGGEFRHRIPFGYRLQLTPIQASTPPTPPRQRGLLGRAQQPHREYRHLPA